MSGESESKKDLSSKLDQVNKVLDEYEKSFKINFVNNDEIDEYLQIKKSQLEALTPIQCHEIAVCLSNHLMYLQKELNRQTAIFNWANSNLNTIIGRHLNDYDDFKYEAKVLRIISEYDTAKKLDELKQAVQLRVDTLSYLPQRIEFFIKTLNNLGNTKAYKV